MGKCSHFASKKKLLLQPVKGDIVLTVLLRMRCSVQKWQRKRSMTKSHSCVLPIPNETEKAACTCCLLHDPTAARIVHYHCLKNNSNITKIREVRTNRLNRRKGNNCHRYLELHDWRHVNKETQTRRSKVYKPSYNPCLAVQFTCFRPHSICWATVHPSRGQPRAP